MSFVGILMLQTRFPRPPGDIGNPQTFAALAIPVRYRVVGGASPQRVVRGDGCALLPDFIDAARQLVADGAALLSTSCGFLVQFQQPLQRSVPVPVLSSALLWLERLGPDSAVLTIDAQALGPGHLAAAGAAPDTPVAGVTPGCEFQRRILGDEPQLDLQQAQRDVVQAAMQLVARHPQVRSIVLECSNMVPYAPAVAAATRCRVEHIISLIGTTWKH